MNTHFPCHSLPGFNKFCVLKRHESTGLSYKFWSRGLLAPVKFNPSLPTHFFPEDDGLRKMLIPFLREASKEGMCCKCIRNGDVSIYTQSGMCCELHPLCVWHTDPRVGHAPVRLFTHIFPCFMLSLCLHTASPHGCFDTIQDRMNKTRQDYSGDVCCVMQINIKKTGGSVCKSAAYPCKVTSALLFHRGEGVLQAE